MHRNLAAAESIALVPSPEQQLDQELRILNDTKTWLAETLHGSMRTRFEFDYDGLYLRSEDGSDLDGTFDHAIAEARHMTEWNPAMSFELRRRLTERGELNDMYDMVSGEKPNTMVVFSDYPEELKSETESIGGYNADRQQTMMRVITWDSEARKMTVITQSLDGSNRKALEAAGEAIGVKFEPGELLGQRQHLDLDPAWSEKLPDILTESYDDSMQEQRGVEHHAGIAQEPYKNIVDTYEFVSAQKDLINWFVAKKLANPKDAEKHRYELAATFKARHEEMLASLRRKKDQQLAVGNAIVGDMFDLPSLNAMARALPVEQQLRINGFASAAAGDVFSGCGASISAGREEDGDFPGSSFGGAGYSRSGGWSRNKKGGSCEYISKSCPKCDEKNVLTTETDHEIKGSCGCVAKKTADVSLAMAT